MLPFAVRIIKHQQLLADSRDAIKRTPINNIYDNEVFHQDFAMFTTLNSTKTKRPITNISIEK